MTYENFLNAMLTYKKLSKNPSELHDIGMDFYEGKYQLASLHEKLFESVFESHYTTDGIEWIDWFVYDNNWGTAGLKAKDSDGNLITHSYESLWELLEKDYKLNEKI
jgi:hypothetical protein